MPSPSERSFAAFPRGHIRDEVILAHFRAELRLTVNPATGFTFTEDEVQRATEPGTRFYIEADAIDLLGQAQQQRAVHLAAQLDPRRANGKALEQLHGQLWLGPDSKLPATGAGGPVRATGMNGSVIAGSLSVPDPAAAVATDANGLRYQVLESVAVVNGEAMVTLQGIDAGAATRLPVDAELRWSQNVPPGLDPTATVLAPFDGGFDQETDEAYGDRVQERMRDRPASGNAAHFRAWAREASSAVGDVFVYPCALHAGSTLVCVLERRSPQLAGMPPEGPLARVASVATLNTVADKLITPASPLVPERAFVLVTSATPQPAGLVLRLSLATGRSGGWADVVPWPPYSPSFPAPAIATVDGTGLVLTMTTDQPLPNGAASLTGAQAPRLMAWNQEVSRFAQLIVASVTDPAPGTSTARAFTITLTSAPELYDEAGELRGVQVGDRVSPHTDRAEIIADALEAYFDGLGPGEVVPSSDVRFARAQRQPATSKQKPSRAGQAVLGMLIEALGGSAADAELTSISRNAPDLPVNLTEGPCMVTLGLVTVLPL